jgi:hypothetical protein
MTNATVPKSLMGCISSAVTSFSMQLQPKRTDDFKDGVEAWATITGERFVETFTRESGIAQPVTYPWREQYRQVLWQ